MCSATVCKVCNKENCTVSAHRPLTSEQQQLVVKHQALAHKLARKFLSKGFIPSASVISDEITSAALMALVKAAQGYDASLGEAFGTYFGKACHRDMRRAFDNWSANGMCANFREDMADRMPKVDSFTKLGSTSNRTLQEHDMESYDLVDHKANQEKWTDSQWAAVLNKIAATINPKVATIIRLSMLERMSNDEIGQQLEISASSVSGVLRNLPKILPDIQEELLAIV